MSIMRILDLAKQIAEGRMDSRLKYKKITHPTNALERTFCVLCSKPKGWVTQESYNTIKALNIIVICDDCHANLGEMPLQRADIQEVGDANGNPKQIR